MAMVDLGAAVVLGKRIRNVQRFGQIVNTFAKHGLWSVVEALKIRHVLSPEQLREAEGLSQLERLDGKGRESVPDPESETSIPEIVVQGLPARLRRSFEELGPAWVKLGQVLATREDLLPAPVIEELKKLHTQVSALDYSAIERTLKEELGDAKLAQFQSIERTPLAAGSIAQVHRATLKDGRQIILKVQRPQIASTIETDLSLMEVIASLMERYLPESRSFRPTVMIEEFGRATRGELDFVREGGTTSKISANFAAVDYIVIPEVHWQLSTPRVLAQSFLEGFSVYDSDKLKAHGINPVRLVEKGLTAFMQMVFVDGFYHGDLHPGNMLILPDGRIGILDFGVGVLIGRAARERLAGLLMALVEEDFETMVSHFVDLSSPGPDFDLELFTHEVSNAMAPFVGLRLSEIRSGRLLWDLARIAGRHGAPMPRELVLFLRTMAAFEGIGLKLDPNFDVIASCEKFTGQLVGQMYSAENLKRQGLLVARDFAQLGRTAPRQFKGILKALLDGTMQVRVASDDMAKMAQSVEVASSRLSMGLIASSLIIASSILIFAHAGREFESFSTLGLVELGLAGLIAVYLFFRSRGKA